MDDSAKKTLEKQLQLLYRRSQGEYRADELLALTRAMVLVSQQLKAPGRPYRSEVIPC